MILSTTFRADAGDITTHPMEHAVTRTYARQGTTRQDMYTHNDRSALTAATLGTDACRYTYDNDADGGKASWTNAQHLPEGREAERRLRVNIGNRKTAQEGTEAPLTTYAANGLNQYTAIAEGTETPFTPTYDADGNQTKVKTSTGEWNITYNGLNQAIRFEQGGKRVECVYDYMNRRVEKAVYEGDILLSRKRFIYKDYLQIAELDAMNVTDTAPARLVKTYLWDPAEPVATRVLIMRNHAADGSHEDLYYTHDLLKNTTALFGILAGRRALYEYAPYGATIKSEGDMAEGNPFRSSSEYHDDELGLIQYNYRYLNPYEGRWLSYDPGTERKSANLYDYLGNKPTVNVDILGAWELSYHRNLVTRAFDDITHRRPELAPPDSDSYKKRLSQGSTLPDNPTNSWWCLFPPCAFVKLGQLMCSHYGSDQWKHAMNPGDMAPEDIRDTIINELTKINDERKGKLPDPVDLGNALHSIADSFSPSHTERNEIGEITQYNDYSKQDPSEHAKKDVTYPKGSLLHDSQNQAYKAAQAATTKVAEALMQPNTTNDQIRDMIRNDVMKHNPAIK